MKKMISALMIVILLTNCMPNITYAKENDEAGAYIYDAALERNVFLNVVEVKEQVAWKVTDTDVYNYEIYVDGVLDYTLEVDLSKDRAIMEYSNGTSEEMTISEHVTMRKSNDITTRVIETEPINHTFAVRDYIDNEPLEITSTGAQISLGTTVYSGYETMGSRTYSNPTETAYLQRKNSGYVTFDSYDFTVTAGTTVGAAIGIIIASASSAGIALAVSVVTTLFCALIGATVDGVVDYLVEGSMRCREYRWDYRVRRNSNTGTIILSEYKYRYWWEMYNNKGVRRFEPRTDIRDGWLLTNSDMIAYALGRM